MNAKSWSLYLGAVAPFLLFGPFAFEAVIGRHLSLPYEDEYPLASCLLWLGLVVVLALCAIFALRLMCEGEPLSTVLRIMNGFVAILAALLALLLILYTLHPA